MTVVNRLLYFQLIVPIPIIANIKGPGNITRYESSRKVNVNIYIYTYNTLYSL